MDSTAIHSRLPSEMIAAASDAIGKHMDGAVVHDTILLATVALGAALSTLGAVRKLVEANRCDYARIGVSIRTTQEQSNDRRDRDRDPEAARRLAEGEAETAGLSGSGADDKADACEDAGTPELG